MTVILLDIEGTTTSISFVYDVLFPYARAHALGFLEQHADAPEVVDAIAAIVADAAADGVVVDGGDLHAVHTEVIRQMDADKKATGLKALQGHIWARGYREGALHGHVYPDVPDAMARWRAAGYRIAIYSSGSVAAQRLIFGHSTAGDLTPHLSAYFDTTTGPKKQAASYRAIADALDCPIDALHFATDNLDEANAAAEAGAHVVVLQRPGNPPTSVPAHPVAADFSAWPAV